MQAVEHSMWATWPDRVSEENFRREGDYLAQFGGGMTPEHYRATYEHVKQNDRFGLLPLFSEDDAFGVVSVEVDGRKVSRDLLDSVVEISFLRRMLELDRYATLRVLDIGAGYGRFAHRFTQALPGSVVYCTDAIAKSAAICKRYLAHRGVSRASVIVPEAVDALDVDLAVNIHSWSECTLSAIISWLNVLAALKVRYLFLVPHDARCLTMETDGNVFCFFPWIIESGYRLVISEPKYPASLKLGLYPTQYYLFEREMN